MTIRELPPLKFVSETSIVEVIRGMLDIALVKRITYLEVNYKIKGDPELKSHSIITNDDLMGIDT